jgi:hypothetical protein
MRVTRSEDKNPKEDALRRLIPRLALVATSAVALSGFAATSALAQNTPTVQLAASITSESAVLSGTIDTTTTAGSNVCYSFEYDTIGDWLGNQDNVSYTDPACVPTGSGTLTVSATIGCYPAASCAGDALPLNPDSTYQFVLGAQYEPGGSYLNAEQINGQQLEFTTLPLGAVKLTSSTVAVKHGKASVFVACNGELRCTGSLELTVKSGRKTLVALATAVNLPAGKSSTITGKLSAKARKLLDASKSRKLAGKLTVIVTTDQSAPTNKTVTLVGS